MKLYERVKKVGYAYHTILHMWVGLPMLEKWSPCAAEMKNVYTQYHLSFVIQAKLTYKQGVPKSDQQCFVIIFIHPGISTSDSRSINILCTFWSRISKMQI